MGRFYFLREDGGIYSHTDDVESAKWFTTNYKFQHDDIKQKLYFKSDQNQITHLLKNL